MDKNIIDEKEKVMQNFLKTQGEKLDYLGEFKENIIIALEKKEIERKIINKEVLEKMKSSDAILLKIRRDIDFDCIKLYVDAAEKIGLKYKLVDDITFRGNIGLVVVSKKPLDNANKNIVAESAMKIYTDAGLTEAFIYGEGHKICPKHYKEIQDKLPQYLDRFEEMNLFDRLFGKVCPIDMYQEIKKNKEK